MNTKTINPVEIEKVIGVYSGKDGKCCCGCAGTHRYPSAKRVEAEKDRGYAIGADEINDNQVRRVVGIINANLATAEVGSNNVSVVIGARLYIAYIQN